MISGVNQNFTIRQRNKNSIVQIEDRVHCTNVLNLNLILLNSNIVGAIVDVDASVLGAEPHCRLLMVGVIVDRTSRVLMPMLH